ncbi:MAG: accessory gene regulator B family protein [Lachnospiraceae bacterium]|nr:accessory gene regulator B family protein [Lachnospiraceae bacterium]
MRRRVSDAMAEKFILEGIISEEDKEIYAYGWRALSMWMLCTLTMFVIGALMGEFLYTIIYFVSFSIVRAFYDGYHAKNRAICFITSTVVFIGCVLMGKYVIIKVEHYLMWTILILTGLLINGIRSWEYVYSTKKKVTHEKQKYYIGMMVFMLLLILFAGMEKVQFGIGYTAVFTAIMLASVLFCMKRIARIKRGEQGSMM